MVVHENREYEDEERTTAIEQAKILKALIGIQKVNIILNTFIKAFLENSVLMPDGNYRLFGNFNLGGTVSGRLSSSKPNLTNIPSGSKYGKLIKQCFVSDHKWLFVGADFNALEARVGALVTKDPAKLIVYTDGYDSHCWNCWAYFKKQMPDIINTAESINSIAEKYPDFRQKSKTVTFALQYAGTEHTLVNNCGFKLKEAKDIVDSYHQLYSVSSKWTQDRLTEATKTGYVVGAFGLKLRTPILGQVTLGLPKTPQEANKESRTAGNMLFQSYGMLNNRAAIEFQERVLASEYRLDILPVAMIHDACYYIARNTAGCIEWLNNNLVACMEWQKLPELKHSSIGLGGETEIYYPSWATPTAIPNYSSIRKIIAICEKENEQSNRSE